MPEGVIGWSKWVLQVWFVTFVGLPVLLFLVKVYEFKQAVTDSLSDTDS